MKGSNSLKVLVLVLPVLMLMFTPVALAEESFPFQTESGSEDFCIDPLSLPIDPNTTNVSILAMIGAGSIATGAYLSRRSGAAEKGRDAAAIGTGIWGGSSGANYGALLNKNSLLPISRMTAIEKNADVSVTALKYLQTTGNLAKDGDFPKITWYSKLTGKLGLGNLAKLDYSTKWGWHLVLGQNGQNPGVHVYEWGSQSKYTQTLASRTLGWIPKVGGKIMEFAEKNPKLISTGSKVLKVGGAALALLPVGIDIYNMTCNPEAYEASGGHTNLALDSVVAGLVIASLVPGPHVPFTAAAALAITAGRLIYDYRTEIAAGMTAVWNYQTTMYKETAKFMYNSTIKPVANAVTGAVKSTVSAIKSVITSPIIPAVSAASSSSSSSKSSSSKSSSSKSSSSSKVKSTVKKVASTVKTTVKKVASKVTSTVKKTVSKVTSTVKKVASTVKTTVKKVASTVKTTVKKTVSTVKSAVSKTVSKIKSFFKKK